MMNELAIVTTAILLGGMTFFSFGFAPVLFKQLPIEQVRPLLRGTFPYYYLAIIWVAGAGFIFACNADNAAGTIMAAVVISTIYARQSLMGQINAATDRGDQRMFSRLHGLSVVIQLIQIGLVGWALLLLT